MCSVAGLPSDCHASRQYSGPLISGRSMSAPKLMHKTNGHFYLNIVLLSIPHSLALLNCLSLELRA